MKKPTKSPSSPTSRQMPTPREIAQAQRAARVPAGTKATGTAVPLDPTGGDPQLREARALLTRDEPPAELGIEVPRRQRPRLIVRRPLYALDATFRLEVARFPERDRISKERQATWESRQDPVHQEEDRCHRAPGGCPNKRRCSHPSHVLPQRPWPAKGLSTTPRSPSLGIGSEAHHLGTCEKDTWRDMRACPDDSHRIAPRPLDEATGYCCEGKHKLKSDPSWAWECPNIDAETREWNQIEARLFPNDRKGQRGQVEPWALAVSHRSTMSESTMFWFGRDGQVKDETVGRAG